MKASSPSIVVPPLFACRAGKIKRDHAIEQDNL